MITITEALAEIKTIAKRVDNKATFINGNLWRPSIVTDALSNTGGAPKRVKEEFQAVGDLISRTERIRVRIQEANQKNTLTIQGTTKTVAAWLAWRKECAPRLKTLLGQMSSGLNTGHNQVRAQNPKQWDVTEHFSSDEVRSQIEAVDNILGELDGRLSLFNATCTVDVN